MQRKHHLYLLTLSILNALTLCNGMTLEQMSTDEQSFMETRIKVQRESSNMLSTDVQKQDAYGPTGRCAGCVENITLDRDMLQEWREHLRRFEGQDRDPDELDQEEWDAKYGDIKKTSIGLLDKSLDVGTSTSHRNTNRYVPGTKGGPWTAEESMIIKAKLWRIFDMTTTEIKNLLATMPDIGYPVRRWHGASRMAPSAIRLAFHGCVRDLDGSGGCDGCLYWDGVDHVWMDYIGQGSLPAGTRGVPNFNGGLGNWIRILEKVYREKDFPTESPILNVAPRDSGKSRSDLWSFAGLVASEHGMHTHNMVCRDQQWEWPTVYPDSLDTNGFWGMHCVQKQGEPSCAINFTRRTVFKTGRKDCVPTQLYKKTADSTCLEELEITTQEACDEAATEANVGAQFDDQVKPHCKVTSVPPKACDWQCYLDRYKGLARIVGATNTAAAENHYNNFGQKEGRNCYCQEQTIHQMCTSMCTGLGHMNNDPGPGSDGMISCFQACMIHARGTSQEDCNTECVRHPNTQCSVTVNGFGYQLCGTRKHYSDAALDKLMSNEACRDGCALETEEPKTLCHLNTLEKYKAGQDYYVDQPLIKPQNNTLYQCREGILESEAECKYAAGRMYMPYDGDGKDPLDIPGCYAMNRVIHVSGAYQVRVYWGQGSAFTQMHYPPPYGFSSVRAVCRMHVEKVEPFMAATWGKEPESQKGGDQTVKWFKDEFNLTPRQSVAAMAAHTMGRFHATRNLFRYIWVRNGGATFNNEYFRNIAGKRDYRFFDDCTKVGSAYKDPPFSRWRPGARGEMTSGGPVSWTLDRHICAIDCSQNRTVMANFRHATQQIIDCCQPQDLPAGAMCKPDNGRDRNVDAVDGDDAPNSGCELFHTEGGNHEIALPAELGLMFKFELSEHDYPKYCQGFEPGRQSGPRADPQDGCELQDLDAGNGMKLYEIVELYAENQNVMADDYFEAFELLIENGVQKPMDNAPDTTTDIICPNNHKVINLDMRFGFCFDKKKLSDPFVLVSEMDHHILEISEEGQLGLGPFRNVEYLQSEEKMRKLDPRYLWHTVTAENGKEQLISGMPEYGVGRLFYENSLLTHGAFGLARNWAGHKPDLLYVAGTTVPSMKRFIRPTYFTEDQLSDPFVLVSQLDNLLLEVNVNTGALDLHSQRDAAVLQDPTKLDTFPSQAVWRTADVDGLKVLVNGLAHAGLGRLTYNIDTAIIGGEIGIASRNFKGQLPNIDYNVPQAWAQMKQFVAPLYFKQDQLSAPFVLYSAMDKRLLQADKSTFLLAMRAWDPVVLRDEAAIQNLPPEALWYTVQTSDGTQLVNGLVHGNFGKLIWENNGHITGLNGVVARAWNGNTQEHVVQWQSSATGAAATWFQWHKPVYYTQNQLSEPFILVSESDNQLLQTNVDNGKLEMGVVRDVALFQDPANLANTPVNTIWYVANLKDGKGKLVNGNVHASNGDMDFDTEAGSVEMSAGYLIRSWTGDLTHSQTYTWTNTGHRWLRSIYVKQSSLSAPFILMSHTNKHLVQVSSTGQAEMGPLRDPALLLTPDAVKDLPATQLWYLGPQDMLVNGHAGNAMGIWLFDKDKEIIKAGRGWLNRAQDIIVYGSTESSAGRFSRPVYVPEASLSLPSVLISRMDSRLLVAKDDGLLDVGDVWDPKTLTNVTKVDELPSAAIWYVIETSDGKQLINDRLRYMDPMIYSGSRINTDGGYATRNWAGWTPTMLYGGVQSGNRQFFDEPALVR